MLSTVGNKITETRSNEYYSNTNVLNTDIIEFNSLSFKMKENDRIGIALTSVFKIEKVFETIIDITTDVLEVKCSSIMILKEDSLIIKASKHIPENIMKNCRVILGTGISGWVASQSEHLLVNDIERNGRFKKRNERRYSGKSFISMPVTHSNKVIGVINVSDKDCNGTFTEEDVQLLKTIAKYSSIAIRNALLINQSKKNTTLDELNNFYNDNTNKYLPVTLQSLKSGPFSKSELYIANGHNGKRNYVLYWNGGRTNDASNNSGNLFDSDKREEFIRKNINRLYVLKNGRKQYWRFIETKLEDIIRDNNINTRDRLHVINDVAANIVKDVSTSSDEITNIDRTKHWISNVINYIISRQDNTSDLIKALKRNGSKSEHFINVTELGLMFAIHMGMNTSELNKLGLGLFYQDVGMRKIHTSIINKPTRLSKQEINIVKEHTEAGFQILQNTGMLTVESCLPAILHHENFDGSGYPYGLNGKKIDYFGRVSRILDVYNAITTDRPYATAINPYLACTTMKESMNGVFDSDILNNFIDFLKTARIITTTASLV